MVRWLCACALGAMAWMGSVDHARADISARLRGVEWHLEVVDGEPVPHASGAFVLSFTGASLPLDTPQTTSGNMRVRLSCNRGDMLYHMPDPARNVVAFGWVRLTMAHCGDDAQQARAIAHIWRLQERGARLELASRGDTAVLRVLDRDGVEVARYADRHPFSSVFAPLVRGDARMFVPGSR